MGLFNRKPNTDKVKKEMLSKAQQIEKLKEEMRTMADKLVLKDGKLQKVSDTPVQVQPQAQPMLPPTQMFDEVTGRRFDDEVAIPRPPLFQRPQQQPQPMPQQRQPVYQQPQPMPPQYQQQQQYQQPQIIAIAVVLHLLEGNQITIEVANVELEQFLGKLNDAIDNQIAFVVGDKTIAGRHIIYYEFGQ